MTIYLRAKTLDTLRAEVDTFGPLRFHQTRLATDVHCCTNAWALTPRFHPYCPHAVREITNHKSQVTNNVQIPIFKCLKYLIFGYCYLFVAWCLVIGISRTTYGLAVCFLLRYSRTLRPFHFRERFALWCSDFPPPCTARKFEYRNPKSQTNSNVQNLKF